MNLILGPCILLLLLLVAGVLVCVVRAWIDSKRNND